MTLTMTDFAAISPLLILLAGTLILLLIESFADSRRSAFFVAMATLMLALYAVIGAPISDNKLLTAWLRFDSVARFFTILFLCIGLGTALLSDSFCKRFGASQGEYYFLLLAAVFGLLLIGMSADFLTLFLGIETLSLSLYVWCGFMKRWQLSQEAAVKYFLMGALAAAFLLYGIALIYGAVGTTRFEGLLQAYQAIATPSQRALFLGGIGLVTLGLAFEAAIIPFHVWAPDVYEGASTPVTAFMAVGTKAGAFAAFIIVFLMTLPHFDERWNQAAALLAYPTLIYANFVALRQTQLRRFFAYSGISHAGFLLLPLVAGTPDALLAMQYYLIVYALATFGAFAALTFLDQRQEGVLLQDLKGLFRRAPLLAAILALCLLTLAGIPPTAGFFAKFYIFKVAYQAGYIGLVIVGLLTTILAAYYYLRMVGIMFVEASEKDEKLQGSWPAAVVGACALIAILFLSFYPMPLLHLLALIN
jgi:NADH-quinone oxidoreductase subunit N